MKNEEEIQKEETNNQSKIKRPQFISEQEEKITSAQKGTLTHLCLQKLNPKKEYNLNDIQDLIQDLETKKIITQEEKNSININKIFNFTKSKIWKELKTAKEIYREKPFYINIEADEIYNNGCKDKILVQGIIDLYYIDSNDKIVLVDYKTDYVEEEKKLIEKYKEQLTLYKRALESALNKKIDKVLIYSTWLDKDIDFFMGL